MMRRYVVIYTAAGSAMGSPSTGPFRRIIEAESDDMAKAMAKEIARQWSTVYAVFPEDSEILLYAKGL